MKRAASLDQHNLLVQTGILRYEMRRPNSISQLALTDRWRAGRRAHRTSTR